jgi:hypothetical protein
MRRYPAPHSGQMMSDFHIGGVCDADSQHSSAEPCHIQTDPLPDFTAKAVSARL